MPRAIEDPILAYTAAEGEINQVIIIFYLLFYLLFFLFIIFINQIQWGATQPDWIAICYNKNLEILRVWGLISTNIITTLLLRINVKLFSKINWTLYHHRCVNKFCAMTILNLKYLSIRSLLDILFWKELASLWRIKYPGKKSDIRYPCWLTCVNLLCAKPPSYLKE